MNKIKKVNENKVNEINELNKYIKRSNKLLKEKKYIKAYRLLSKVKKLRRIMNVKNNTVTLQFEMDSNKKEWGSENSICIICDFGWSKTGEPCKNFNEGVGKEGVGNNCPYFK